MLPVTDSSPGDPPCPLNGPFSAGRGWGTRLLAAETDALPALSVNLFVAYAASLPFEAWDYDDVGRGTINSVSKLLGYAFACHTVLYPQIFFRLPNRATIAFGCYGLLLILWQLVLGSPALADTWVLYGILFQNLVMLHFAIPLLSQKWVGHRVVLAFSLACFALACLQLLGPAAIRYTDVRVSSLAWDPNNAASLYAVGAVALLSLVSPRGGVSKQVLAGWFVVAVLALASAQTGSRGGCLAGLIGACVVAAISFFKNRSVLLAWIIGLGLLLLTVDRFGSFFVSLFDRFSLAWYDRNLSERDDIWREAIRMFLEKPLLGWGAGNNVRELGARMNLGGAETCTHNLGLWIATESGLIGLAVFGYPIWLCLRRAWTAATRYRHVAPLAMMTTLMAANLSLTWHLRKVFWLSLALAWASQAWRPMIRRRPAGGAGERPRPGIQEAAS